MYENIHDKYQILDYLIEGCQIIDHTYQYVYINDAVIRHSKYTRKYLLGKTMMRCYPGIENTKMYKLLKICMEYEMPKRMTNEFVYPDGSVGWFELVMQKVPEGVLILSSDVTERMSDKNELEIQNRRLKALRTIDLSILRSTDLHEVLTTVCLETRQNCEADAVDVLIFDSQNMQLDYFVGYGFSGREIKEMSIKVSDALFNLLSVHGKHYIKLEKAHFDESIMFKKRLDAEAFSQCYIVPLIAKKRLVGVIEIFLHDDHDMAESQKTFFESIANQASVAIENHNLFEQLIDKHTALINAYDNTIEGWSRALEIRDYETEGHTLRVTKLAIAFAEKLGYEDMDMKAFKYGCLLHDIGKIGISDQILLKPAPLDDAEWREMRKHPVYAKRLLEPISFLRDALEIPYCHHEWVNGEGYPNGLKGSDIPLSARIFTIIDVYDALTSDRPYRSAWSHEKTIEYIVGLAGIQFDAGLVEIFTVFIETYQG